MDTKSAVERSRTTAVPPDNSEAVLEEMLEASLHPDRAHHDELGRTEESVEHHDASPREQAAGPLDVAHVDE